MSFLAEFYGVGLCAIFFFEICVILLCNWVKLIVAVISHDDFRS